MVQTPPPTIEIDESQLAGTVGVYSYRSFDSADVETALTAAFQATPSTECARIEAGSCVRKDCARGHDTVEHAEAGRITATSGSRVLVVEPEAAGPYRAKFGRGPLWETNEPILIEAEGGGISGFRVELVGPAQMTITEPAGDRYATVLIERDQPFRLAWEASFVGEVLMILSTESGASYSTITCSFPLEQHSGVIDRELLADLNHENTPMRLNAGVVHSELIDVGGRHINAVAFAGASSPSGQDAAYFLRFR